VTLRQQFDDAFSQIEHLDPSGGWRSLERMFNSYIDGRLKQLGQ
jgi:hypothetical protein